MSMILIFVRRSISVIIIIIIINTHLNFQC